MTGTVRDREYWEDLLVTGYEPTAADFADLVVSFLHTNLSNFPDPLPAVSGKDLRELPSSDGAAPPDPNPVLLDLRMPSEAIELDPDKTYIVYASACMQVLPAAKAVLSDLSIVKNIGLQMSAEGNADITLHNVNAFERSLVGEFAEVEDFQCALVLRLEESADTPGEYLWTCSYHAVFFGGAAYVIDGHIHTETFTDRAQQVAFNVIGSA